jgi:hypothetical protein
MAIMAFDPAYNSRTHGMFIEASKPAKPRRMGMHEGRMARLADGWRSPHGGQAALLLVGR